jgi:hypothetical protein
MKTTLLGLFVLVLALAAGCGPQNTTGSCLRADHSRCTDYSERADNVSEASDECVLNGDSWSDGACVTTGYVGACRTSSGDSVETVWSLDHSRTATEIQSACVVANGTFIAAAAP